jgi:hypothetical protein
VGMSSGELPDKISVNLDVEKMTIIVEGDIIQYLMSKHLVDIF